FIAPGAVVLGDVTLAARASVWYGAVVRGDMDAIVVGEATNLQDGTIVHVDAGLPTRIGARVGVGHRAILHGCTVEDDCLIGMGSVLLNGAHIGAGSVVAAGAVVPEGTRVPPGSLAAPTLTSRAYLSRRSVKFQYITTLSHALIRKGRARMIASTRIGTLDLSPNAITVLERRYLVKDDQGRPVEGPEDLFWRV